MSGTATGNPAKYHLQRAAMPASGLPPTTGWKSYDVGPGTNLAFGQAEIEDGSLNSTGQQTEGSAGKLSGDGRTIVLAAIRPDQGQWLADVQGKGSVTNPESGVYVHTLAPSQTAITYGSYALLQDLNLESRRELIWPCCAYSAPSRSPIPAASRSLFRSNAVSIPAGSRSVAAPLPEC